MLNDLVETKKQQFTIRAKSCLKRLAQDIVELSQIAHEYHGEFGYRDYIEWVKNDLGLSETYGKNMLNVFKNIGAQCAVDNISSSALRLLAAPSTPEPARQEAIAKAEAGETVTHADAKELVEAHKKIDTLQTEIRKLKNQLPTNDVLQQIVILQKQLEEEKNKPPKPPQDYDAIKSEKARLEKQIKDLKDKQENAIKQGITQELSKYANEINTKQKQIESLNNSIKGLFETRDKLNAEHGVLKVYGDSRDIVRKSLYAIAIAIQDAFEEGPIPESYLAEFRGFIKDMRNGAIAIESQIGGE